MRKVGDARDVDLRSPRVLMVCCSAAEMTFQFNGFGSQASPAAPRFAVPTVVAPPTGAEGEGDEESDEEEEEQKLNLKLVEKPQVEMEVTGEEEEEEEELEQEASVQDDAEETKNPDIKTTTEGAAEMTEEQQELWQVDENVNGIEVMSNAVVDTMQPSLDATIHRIAELKESQLVSFRREGWLWFSTWDADVIFFVVTVAAPAGVADGAERWTQVQQAARGRGRGVREASVLREEAAGYQAGHARNLLRDREDEAPC
ncbi:unnamed protein product [Phytophthora fragariaefolia]|uniref:Unnamed protein product n=1 Tax=Phytophthora fragariaefolia TaxID=1490495 RepID=A0A9W6XFV4_9STRA|nr:unnamed protein product [Phytophthora fragariaefolia]